MNDIKIGVIGLGYVGKACLTFFQKSNVCFSFDINETGTERNLHSLTNKIDIAFICVPTPMKKSGKCDISVVENVLNEINSFENNTTCVIKSTIPPGTTKSFQEKYPSLKIIFNPEFLTEANFINDFENQDRIIIGNDNEHGIVNKLYEKTFPNAQIINCFSEEAEMVKYFTNTFLATKVSFANEMFELCSSIDIDYNNIVEIATVDKRLGNSHFKVPGPDGQRGFGGSCFPKDLNSILYLLQKNKLKSYILQAVWDRNISRDRRNQDWKELKGRAVSE